MIVEAGRVDGDDRPFAVEGGRRDQEVVGSARAADLGPAACWHRFVTEAFHTRDGSAAWLLDMARITFKRAVLLAARLDLDLDDCQVCLACLSFVALPLGAGDERRARSGARQMAHNIWAEGLEQPALLALRRANDEGIPDAEDGLADADENGGRSLMAQAIVWHLGGDLAARARGDLLKMGFEPWPPPELARGAPEGG